MTSEMLGLALSFMEGLDCARSLSVAIMLRYGEWGELFSQTVDPLHYSTHEDYFAAAAANEFLRKLDDPSLCNVDLEAAAISKWRWAEFECFKTNRRLNEIFDFGTLQGAVVEEGIIEFLGDLRKNLFYLLGSGPSSTWLGRLGPGATVSDRSGRTSVLDKFSSVPTMTPCAFSYLFPWMGTKWGAASAARGDAVNWVRGNSFFTVPKSALTRRSCAKEPSLNVFFQLGLGTELRKRLKYRGLDLDLGQEIHRRIACEASKDSSFCTIDLSSASDTLCESLVRNALPRWWYHHLSDLRSPFTRVKGKWHRLEKFSSMGNGFTFELETAVFAAICMSATKGLAIPGVNLFVYGDDIIAPSEFSREILAALRFLGFTPNLEKTFTEGNFRESCGGDFFSGLPARAHYVKEYPNEPQQLISLANGIRRVAHQFHEESPRRSRLQAPWYKVLGCLPTAIRCCRGPTNLGDLVIHDSEDRWAIRWRHSIRYVRCYRPARFRGVRFGRYHPDVQIAAALYGMKLMFSPGGRVYENSMLVTRGGVLGYTVGWVPFS